ncbi:MAG: hypothetical protein KatS3mg081_2596 [Gemmatimonadales bacterium]|nr:MAG: hypothetical protein KatS3mg081_2596 [Gemmatimonadales bacterium]
MNRRNPRTALLAIPASLLCLAYPPGLQLAAAQTGRQALVQGNEAYDFAEFERAVRLLAIGLDPGAGPQDSLWVSGVHKLADALLQSGAEQLAAAWVRWAVRLMPEFPIDSINFPPRVTAAFRAARDFTAANPLPATVSLSWVWPTEPAATDQGALVIQPGNVSLTATLEGGAALYPGVPVNLPAGSYTLIAYAERYNPVRATVEALPGVVTSMVITPEPVAEGLLYVVSRPWGIVFVNGQQVGYTALAGYRLTAGTHRVRVERPGYIAFDTTVTVNRPDQEIRLGNIQLRPERP